MSEGGPPPPNGPSPSITLTPLLRALKTRDHEGLSKLRHALRTPLNQIIGYSELLLESAEETGSTTLVADLIRIHSGGGELLALINDALAAWKIEAGKVDFTALRHDLRVPLGGVISYAEACVTKSIAHDQLPVVKDLEKILQAARNLLALADSSDTGDLSDTASRAPMPIARPDTAAELLNPPRPTVITVRPGDFGISTPPMPSARILAVDDDGLNRDMLIRRLDK